MTKQELRAVWQQRVEQHQASDLSINPPYSPSIKIQPFFAD